MNTVASPQVGWSYRPRVVRVTTMLSFALVAFLLYWGWTHRQYYYFNAEHGVGYLLGILGGSLMLLLAFYPLRKHLRFMRHWGAVRHWFRLHMVFGIAGPLAILYHCNFSTGATNSNVALYSMLIVASSGLMGRYLYAHIHQGLYGRQIELGELRRSWNDARQRMEAEAPHVDAVDTAVAKFETPLTSLRRTLRVGLLGLFLSKWRRLRILRLARREFGRAAEASAGTQEATLSLLRQRLLAAHRVYRFNAFERLFSLWHLLHLPLYFMLIVTGIVHVVAVHTY